MTNDIVKYCTSVQCTFEKTFQNKIAFNAKMIAIVGDSVTRDKSWSRPEKPGGGFRCLSEFFKNSIAVCFKETTEMYLIWLHIKVCAY